MSDFAVEDLARRLIRSGAKPRRNTVDWAYFENTLRFELPEDYKSLMDKVMGFELIGFFYVLQPQVGDFLQRAPAHAHEWTLIGAQQHFFPSYDAMRDVVCHASRPFPPADRSFLLWAYNGTTGLAWEIQSGKISDGILLVDLERPVFKLPVRSATETISALLDRKLILPGFEPPYVEPNVVDSKVGESANELAPRPAGGSPTMQPRRKEINDLADRLLQLGAHPRETPVDWRYFEIRFGLALPEDYKALMDRVCGFTLFGVYFVLEPRIGDFYEMVATDHPDEATLLGAQAEFHGTYADRRERRPDRFPHPLPPEDGSFLLWGFHDGHNKNCGLAWEIKAGAPTDSILGVSLKKETVRFPVKSMTGVLTAMLDGEIDIPFITPDLSRPVEHIDFSPAEPNS
ncbi:MAG: hypothetical protein AAF909_10940 [Pseudomonadota bacterium]